MQDQLEIQKTFRNLYFSSESLVKKLKEFKNKYYTLNLSPETISMILNHPGCDEKLLSWISSHSILTLESISQILKNHNCTEIVLNNVVLHQSFIYQEIISLSLNKQEIDLDEIFDSPEVISQILQHLNCTATVLTNIILKKNLSSESISQVLLHKNCNYRVLKNITLEQTLNRENISQVLQHENCTTEILKNIISEQTLNRESISQILQHENCTTEILKRIISKNKLDPENISLILQNQNCTAELLSDIIAKQNLTQQIISQILQHVTFTENSYNIFACIINNPTNLKLWNMQLIHQIESLNIDSTAKFNCLEILKDKLNARYKKIYKEVLDLHRISKYNHILGLHFPEFINCIPRIMINSFDTVNLSPGQEIVFFQDNKFKTTTLEDLHVQLRLYVQNLTTSSIPESQECNHNNSTTKESIVSNSSNSNSFSRGGKERS